MTTPSSTRVPAVGDIIHYSYLWSYERQAGNEEGRYARPCLVIQVSNTDPPVIRVCPISSKDTPQDQALPLSDGARAALGLTKPSWIVFRESNVFAWPGPDIRSIPDESRQKGAFWRYGVLGPNTLGKVAEALGGLGRRHVVSSRSE